MAAKHIPKHHFKWDNLQVLISVKTRLWRMFFLLCVSRPTCFSLAATSWFAALTEVHIPFLSTVHAELQAGNKPIEIKVKVIPCAAAYSSAQIPSSSLPQSPHVPRLPFISSSLSTRLTDPDESHKTTFWPHLEINTHNHINVYNDDKMRKDARMAGVAEPLWLSGKWRGSTSQHNHQIIGSVANQPESSPPWWLTPITTQSGADLPQLPGRHAD